MPEGCEVFKGELLGAGLGRECGLGECGGDGWGANPAARRLLARVLRFCAKTWRTKRRNGASGTPSSSKRGAKRQRKTVECTSGGGVKACGGSVKSASAGPNICTVTESRP